MMNKEETNRSIGYILFEKSPKRLWHIATAAIIISRLLQYAGQEWCAVFPDTGGYEEYDFFKFLQGHSANGRAPLYPLLMDFTEKVFGAGNYLPLVLAQIAFSMVSLILLAGILENIGIKAPWAQLCLFVYASTPATTGWDTCMMTESLALSATVAFFYCVIKYLRTLRAHWLLTGILLTFFLIFLRPQFLTYWAILLVFCALRMMCPEKKQERKTLIKAILALALCGVVCMAYAIEFHKQFGIYSLTDARARQDLYTCIWRGYYVELDDTEIVNTLKTAAVDKGIWEVCDLGMEYGIVRVNKTTHDFFRQHFARYLMDTIHTMKLDCGNVFEGYALKNPNAPNLFKTIYPAFPTIFGHIYVVFAFVGVISSGIVMASRWVIERKIPWLWAALFTISFSTVIPTYFVTCDEYMRTMCSVLPYLFCIMGLALQWAADALQDHSVKMC